MNGAELTQIVTALTDIAGILDRLGVPGLIGLMLSGPVLMFGAMLSMVWYQSRRMQAMVDIMREETTLARASMESIVESYRRDTKDICDKLGGNQMKTDGYYRDNVALVRDYSNLAKNLHDVVVSNTVVMSELCTILKERGRNT